MVAEGVLVHALEWLDVQHIHDVFVVIFLEKKEDPQTLHLDDSCSHFINY